MMMTTLLPTAPPILYNITSIVAEYISLFTFNYTFYQANITCTLSNLVIHNVTNITLTGVNSVIDCRGMPVGAVVSHVTRFRLEHISLTNCSSKVYTNYTNDTSDGKFMNTAALYLYSCRSVDIMNLSIMVQMD